MDLSERELKQFRRFYAVDEERFRNIVEYMVSTTNALKRVIQDTKPVRPFTSSRDVQYQFVDSARHPKSYYNFTAFGVRICVHYIQGWSLQAMEIPRDDYYFVAVTGYETKNKAFKLCQERFYVDKFNYYNPTTSFTEAVTNFYFFVCDFLKSLGIKLQFEFDFV